MKTISCIIVLGCLGCTSATPKLPPQASALAGHLSRLEQQHLATIRYIHEGKSIITRARESDALAPNVEWWVPGPPDVLPFAGMWRGLDGIAEFQRRLSETMRYDRVDLQQYLVSGEDVAAIFIGEGVAKVTGRPFKSEILRLYTFRNGKVVRVRNYYDTAAYVSAVRGQ